MAHHPEGAGGQVRRHNETEVERQSQFQLSEPFKIGVCCAAVIVIKIRFN
jgi:hypothetical protein